MNNINIENAIKRNKLDETSYIKASISASILDNIDLILESYFISSSNNIGSILLDCFGLLQSLFVGVDALYDLNMALTSNKYNININNNPVLKELRYIRNDVVGHPTNRMYASGAYGFSTIDTLVTNFSRESFSYTIYSINKNKLTKNTKNVNIRELINQYIVEKNKILNNLDNYIAGNNDDTSIYLENIKKMYDNSSFSSDNIDLRLVDTIIKDFSSFHKVSSTDDNRIIWRLNLLKKISAFTSNDKDIKELLLYCKKYLIRKIYSNALKISSHSLVLEKIDLPIILQNFYAFLNSNQNLVSYLDNIENIDFLENKNYEQLLITKTDNLFVKKLLKYHLLTSDKSLYYILGVVIKDYK